MKTSVIAYIRLKTSNTTPDAVADRQTINLEKHKLTNLANYFDVTITEFFIEQPLPNQTPYSLRPQIQAVMERLDKLQGEESLLVSDLNDLAPLQSDLNFFLDFFKKSDSCYLFCGSHSYLNTSKVGDRQELERLRVYA